MVAADVRSLLPANFHEVGNKSLFGAFFELKSLKFEKFSRNIVQKARLKPIGEPSLSLTEKPITLSTQTINIRKSEKSFLFLYSTLDELSNDTSLNSQR